MTKKIHKLKDNTPNQILGTGLISSDSILQLSLKLNSNIGLNFQLTAPVTKNDSSGNEFPCCIHLEEDFAQCTIIKNRHNGLALFTNLPLVDFILFCTGEGAQDIFHKIMDPIKEFDFINAQVPIEIKKLKNLSNILPLNF